MIWDAQHVSTCLIISVRASLYLVLRSAWTPWKSNIWNFETPRSASILQRGGLFLPNFPSSPQHLKKVWNPCFTRLVLFNFRTWHVPTHVFTDSCCFCQALLLSVERSQRWQFVPGQKREAPMANWWAGRRGSIDLKFRFLILHDPQVPSQITKWMKVASLLLPSCLFWFLNKICIYIIYIYMYLDILIFAFKMRMCHHHHPSSSIVIHQHHHHSNG